MTKSTSLTLVGNTFALIYLAKEDGRVNHEGARPPADPLEFRAVEAVRGGDANAFDYLVGKYTKRALSIAWGIVRNAAEAEDLTQEAFVRAFEKIGRFRSGDPFGPWLYRIVTNLALDVVKRRTKFPTSPVEDHVNAPETRVEAQEWDDRAQRIDAALESLPGMQRVVARLYLVEEFEHSEIAAMTGLAEGTVRSHLSLARQRLQAQLHDLREER